MPGLMHSGVWTGNLPIAVSSSTDDNNSFDNNDLSGYHVNHTVGANWDD